MKIIGLTGGIACGKSTVSTELRAHGAAIIDADALAHELSQPHQPIYNAYVERFGREIVTADGMSLPIPLCVPRWMPSHTR